MPFKFGTTSLAKLEGVHPDLVRVMKRAIGMSPVDFRVIEGKRTLARQQQLVAQGASKTMNSRHLVASNGFAHAVDIVPLVDGKVRWDWPLYHQIAPVVKEAARLEKVPLEWGGDWAKFRDGPHWQLPFAQYPK